MNHKTNYPQRSRDALLGVFCFLQIVVIQIVVGKHLPGIIAKPLLYFFQIVVDGIEEQPVFLTPCHSFSKPFPFSHRPQDQLHALLLLHQKKINHRLVCFANLRPSVLAQRTVKVYCNDSR